MGFLDRLLGREEPQRAPDAAGGNRAGYGAQGAAPTPQRSDDEIAVERYRYLLRTAPPETIEQVHEEAFSKLTPEQRKLLFQQLSQNAPAGEQPRGDDPRSLAQSATRAELRQPGTLERSLGGGGGGGMGFGGVFGSSLLGSVAGYVIGSAIVSSFLPGPSDQQASDGGDSGNSGDSGNGGGGDGSGGDGGGAGAAGDASGTSADGWGGGGDFGGGGGGDFGGGGGGDFGF